MNAGSSPSSGNHAVMHAEFMAFLTDEPSLAAARAWAERQGLPPACAQTGGADMFTQMLASATAPQLALVDIDGQEDAAAAVARLANLAPACKLLVTGSANDVGLFRRMIAAGASDYLVKPLDADALGQAVASARSRTETGKAGTREAKIIAVIGVRGGLGASTAAVNLAWALAHDLKFHCALLDLDMHYGTSALALDLEPGRGLRDLVNAAQRIDNLMVASSMTAASDNLSVLGAEEAVHEPVTIDAAAVTALVKEMNANFDFVIIDMPRHLLASQKRLLAAAHEVVLVTEPSLAGIRDTLRIKTAIRELNGAMNLTLVTARTGPSHPAQVDTASFEKSVQMKIAHVIPEDHKVAAEAANAGKAIVAMAPASAVAKAIRALSLRLAGRQADAAEAKAGFMQKIFGGGDRKEKAKS